MMETLGENERPHIVTYALIELLNIAISRLVAIEAYQEAVKNHGLPAEKNTWFSIAFETIVECLILDIASLLDRGKFPNKQTLSTNCNFRELKYVLENTENGPIRFHGIIDRIDALCDANKDLLPDKLRHKRIAHKDLDELFNHDSVDELNKYLESLRDVMKYDKWFYGHLHANRNVMDNHYLLYEQILQIA